MRKYGVVVAAQHQGHQTIKKTALQENWTIQNLGKIGTSPYKLALPCSMAIHNTFHISLLKPYQDNPFSSEMKEPPSSIQIEGEDKYKLDEIIHSRLHYKKLQYRAKCKGYSPEHDKVWYPTENFNHAEHEGQRFHRGDPGKPGMDTDHHQRIVIRTAPSPQTRTTLTHTGKQRRARCPQRYPH